MVRRANHAYEMENESITKHQDGTLDGFNKSCQDNPLNKYDGEFYSLDDAGQLQKILVGYIRDHKSEFTGR